MDMKMALIGRGASEAQEAAEKYLGKRLMHAGLGSTLRKALRTMRIATGQRPAPVEKPQRLRRVATMGVSRPRYEPTPGARGKDYQNAGAREAARRQARRVGHVG